MVANNSSFGLRLSRIKLLWDLLALVTTIGCHLEDQRPWWTVQLLLEPLQAKPGGSGSPQQARLSPSFLKSYLKIFSQIIQRKEMFSMLPITTLKSIFGLDGRFGFKYKAKIITMQT